MKFIHYPNHEEQAAALADHVAGQLRASISRQGIARIALSGGTTPQAFLSKLDKLDLPWEKVRLTLTDERQVPANHPRSNLRFICENLPAASVRAQLEPLYTGEAMDFAALNQRLRQQMLPLDVCVLGMGADGHFASLFPGADQLQAALDPAGTAAVMPIHTDSQPETRISLSLPALLSAPQLHLLIQGKTKRQVLESAAESDSRLPIAKLLDQAGERLAVHYAD